MRGTGIWKSRHQGKIPISELNDAHLIACIKYWRNNVIMPHYMNVREGKRTGNRLSQLLDVWEDLLFEAHQRYLTWDYSTEAPDPDDFEGQTYERRSVKQPPRHGVAARANRSVSL